MLQHMMDLCAGRACMQSLQAQKLGGAPQSVGCLPVLHHLGQPHILHIYISWSQGL